MCKLFVVFSKRIRYSLYIFSILILSLESSFSSSFSDSFKSDISVLLFFTCNHSVIFEFPSFVLFFYSYNHYSLLQNCLVRSSHILSFSTSGLHLFLFLLSTWKELYLFLKSNWHCVVYLIHPLIFQLFCPHFLHTCFSVLENDSQICLPYLHYEYKIYPT